MSAFFYLCCHLGSALACSGLKGRLRTVSSYKNSICNSSRLDKSPISSGRLFRPVNPYSVSFFIFFIFPISVGTCLSSQQLIPSSSKHLKFESFLTFFVWQLPQCHQNTFTRRNTLALPQHTIICANIQHVCWDLSFKNNVSSLLIENL